MKNYKKFMGIVTRIEQIILAVSMLLVLVLTFGNVVARKVFQHSWGFTEEIVVAVFVLLSLLGAGVAAREKGGLVNLGLIPDLVSEKWKKILHLVSCVIGIVYSGILTWMAWGRMMSDATKTPILAIPKSYFWAFVVIGGISLILHIIENLMDAYIGEKEEEVA